MANEMTTQEAITIIAEEAVRYRRMANDLAEDPMDQDGRALEHAKRYRRKADAMDRLVKIARLWNTPVDE
jgi:F0F1-type ATP synthase epsilon subunit